ncbi:Epidermal patterning factor-like protein [Heracleum sosnowskyi]|uniref:Epidermal patterning factor-like protein n=1 Tax=Heracleum sosnowskyi TaxID=360622 RepID=A0AAD8MRW4_9APIA|nr:Epidermal patterning factor-like protein [Heracleum sosnowskyi]
MIRIHSKHSCNLDRPPHFLITILLLFLVLSMHLTFTTAATGRRALGNPVSRSQEEKLSLGAQIGSRPPRCEKRCATCGHCEAIQIPTPHTKRNKNNNGTGRAYKITYSRSDIENSNYKPMSWKCKCGNIILNP